MVRPLDTDNALTAGKEEPRALHHLVTFRLGTEIYGLPVGPIEQIVPMVTITPLPQIGDPVAGVINVRGKAVPVVDLRRHIGLDEAAYLLHTPIVLAHIGPGSVGLVVDQVLDVLSLPPDRLIPPAEILPQGIGQAPVLSAVARISDRFALLLDPDHLFGPEQQEALARAAELLPQLAAEQEQNAKADT